MIPQDDSITNGIRYDYWSVMHYGRKAFSNGNGSTIITTDPGFQDVIGQRLEMSPSDVLELNLLYKCGKCSSCCQMFSLLVHSQKSLIHTN